MRILSIDGGGIRGIIPVLVLDEIERRSGRRIQELFDRFAGTSTGGILALGLSVPGPDGSPLYHPRDGLPFYERDGDRIFSSSRRHQVASGHGLLEERYEPTGIEEVLHEAFGDTMLSEASPDVLIAAYELERREPYLFHSVRARESPHDDFPMRVVARATTAAPTYFPPLHVPREPDPLTFIDGGVCIANPSMCIFTEARRVARARDITLVSLGTGTSSQPMRYSDARHWGLSHWARPIFDLSVEGVSHMTHLQLSELPLRSYHRLQADLGEHHVRLDDAREDNVVLLREAAERLIADADAELDAICERLTSRH